MAFAHHLLDSLKDREREVGREFAAGASLETVLSRHLLTVERAAETEMLTSILLLDPDAMHLTHGAAPSLPKAYCDAIDGAAIGPSAGSCGTAAFTRRAVYVTDIATDPLWRDYREVALQHGLRACWSTPIFNDRGTVIGTFAVYHLTPRSPTPDEVEAIRIITDHVAQAIDAAHGHGVGHKPSVDEGRRAGPLRLVCDDESANGELAGAGYGQAFSVRLQQYADKFDQYADAVTSRELADALKAVARDCSNLVEVVRKI